ncbi:MAG: ACT domain-containing protein [Gemmatimonadaceae bacterium]|nr:ACT domain-containing protein [Gemmatimonadaceae bacterium]
MRVAIQGEPGAFSDAAARQLLGEAVELVCCAENREVTRQLAAGGVHAAVLPIENSLAGSVFATYDAILAEPAIVAVGQTVLPIRHCVLGIPGATLGDLRTVESHPVALAQCRAFLETHPHLVAHATHDTAGSARLVRAAGDRSRAAIASAHAARVYDLAVLAAGVEDRPDNRTRFLLLRSTRDAPGAAPAAPGGAPPGAPAQTMLVYTTANVPGALLRTLEPLAERGMNMVRIESRPAGEPWTYQFIVEFEHTADPSAVQAVIAAIAPHTRGVRHVGTFARAAAAG